MTITPSELAELKRLCEAATPEPWTAHRADRADNTGGYDYCLADQWNMIIVETFAHVGRSAHGFTERPACANADFIAAARTVVPRLIAALEEAKAENERLRGLVRRVAAGPIDTDTTAALRKEIASWPK